MLTQPATTNIFYLNYYLCCISVASSSSVAAAVAAAVGRWRSQSKPSERISYRTEPAPSLEGNHSLHS